MQKFTDGAGSGINIAPDTAGVWGDSDFGIGAVGTTADVVGVLGRSDRAEFGIGVAGVCAFSGGGALNKGVSGYVRDPNAGSSYGVFGSVAGGDNTGVGGHSPSSLGVWGTSESGYGVAGTAENIGVYAANTRALGNVAYLGTQALAADFYGTVWCHNTIIKAGGGFRIDDPRKPAEGYLQHSFVESSDMKNIYDGIVTLDSQGAATVKLPSWLEQINGDFRYQLTCVGAHAPVYIAKEVKNGSFKIAGGRSRMRVSWCLTGIRKDPWAKKNRLQVELKKSKRERGYYIHPEIYGKGPERDLRRALYGDLPGKKLAKKHLLKHKKLLEQTT